MKPKIDLSERQPVALVDEWEDFRKYNRGEGVEHSTPSGREQKFETWAINPAQSRCVGSLREKNCSESSSGANEAGQAK